MSIHTSLEHLKTEAPRSRFNRRIENQNVYTSSPFLTDDKTNEKYILRTWWCRENKIVAPESALRLESSKDLSAKLLETAWSILVNDTFFCTLCCEIPLSCDRVGSSRFKERGVVNTLQTLPQQLTVKKPICSLLWLLLFLIWCFVSFCFVFLFVFDKLGLL